MTDVVSVRFSARGKAYYFDPNGNEVKTGDTLIVETSKGLDVGECANGNHPVEDECLIPPLRPVIRVANEGDMKIIQANKTLEKQALVICREKIASHKLDMKLVSVECGFEGSKILFFFTSDGRVDFRELVKDLAAVFRTRIELRQIGVRDETKMLGGLGICGRPYCCNQFLNDFEPVSTKMAKTQSMSLNPTKISGSCGRLMCCLRYEQDAYEELVKTIPKNGAFVQTTGGYGNVVSSSVLRQKIKVRIDGESDQEVKVFDADQVAVISGGRPKPGESLPQVLHYVPKEEAPAELVADPWAAPTMFADNGDAAVTPKLDSTLATVLSAGEGAKPREGQPSGGRDQRRRNRSNKPRTQDGGNGNQPKEPRTASNGNQPKEPRTASNGNQPKEPRTASNGNQPKEPRTAGNGNQPKEPRTAGNGQVTAGPGRAAPQQVKPQKLNESEGKVGGEKAGGGNKHRYYQNRNRSKGGGQPPKGSGGN